MSIFSDLLDFIQNRMRMSHIYQPVMLTTLIKGGGTASVKEIASQFAQRDEALIEYYSKITKEMPGRVTTTIPISVGTGVCTRCENRDACSA